MSTLCPSDTKKRRRGLTAIELLAATTLAALLMAALLGVLLSLTRGHRSLAEKYPAESWEVRLAEQFHWDLTNSRSIKTRENEIELRGFASRAPVTGVPLLGEATVYYRIETVNDQSLLVRQEHRHNARGYDAIHREIVCLDVETIGIGHPGANAAGGVATEKPTLQDGILPSRVAVYMEAVNGGTTMFYKVFNLHY